MANSQGAASLHQRLLQDIAELQTKPYPNITLHIQEDNLTEACLVLTVDTYGPMHLTVTFPKNYPLSPPSIRMNSNINHPNIFGDYICASILNTREGYTPAYTLKAIAIQLLSFFSSEEIEQVGSGRSVKLDTYRDLQRHIKDSYVCKFCQYGDASLVSIASYMTPGWDEPQPKRKKFSASTQDSHALTLRPSRSSKSFGSKMKSAVTRLGKKQSLDIIEAQLMKAEADFATPLISAKLPDEIILLFCDHLDHEDMVAFARAWSRFRQVMTDFDVIRTRELQCFCLKKDYKSAKLGVGVRFGGKGVKKLISSEFDLLSEEGFRTHNIRRSVQGVQFDAWLPLPISRGHWESVRKDAEISLTTISESASLNAPLEEVVYHFMNDIVVKLNEKASEKTTRSTYYPFEEQAQSSLTHASEKAIESYFHLFHLLLCLATENPSITRAANRSLRNFIGGATSKRDCPSLGYLLVAALISDVEISQEVLKAIIKETIIRNVVWMLDKRGSGKAELSYLEPTAISEYRLRETFQAGKTSYRLLMFLNLFRRTAVGSVRKSLIELRDEAFARHGAPPRGSAKGLADGIKKIHEIDSFPGFFEAMHMPKPCPQNFTTFLRKCVGDSVAKGYSSMPLSQGKALFIRQHREPNVEVATGVTPIPCHNTYFSFFPNQNPTSTPGGNWRGQSGRGDGNGYTRGGLGGRGRGRGRGGY
jgi:ubiquitin-protein ligase